MSVASEITRIQGAKADLKTAINAKTDAQHKITTETIDDYATFVNSISGGGSATLITKSITQNGTYNASSDSADGYLQVTVNVSGGGTVEPEEKDVNYYDYDGTRLYSYTKDEFLALETEPELPTKNGITYTAWNVIFKDVAKPLVGRGDKLDIGALGKPSDCDIKIFINLPEEFKSPYIYVGTDSSCTIDWGDGSSLETYTPTNNWINPSHTFTKGGKYEIKLTNSSSSGSFYLKSTGQNNSYNDGQKTGALLWGGTSSDNTKTNMIYASCIEEIWLGEKVAGSNTTHQFSGFTNLKAILTNERNVDLSDKYSFFNCRSLKTFNVPKNTIHYFKDYTFKNCNSLKRITGTKWRLAYGSSGTATKTFENCFSLEKMPTPAPTFPALTNNIDLSGCSYLFENCYLLSHIYIGRCTKIGTSTFDGNYPTVKVFDFSNVTSIPTLSGSGAFSSGTSDYEIWVPSSLYRDWIAAENWSNIGGHIVSK